MHKRSENNIFKRVLKFPLYVLSAGAGQVHKSILCMSLNIKKVLIFVSSLLVLLNTNVLNAATVADDIRKAVQPVHVKKTVTSMRLSTRKNRVYLDVKPAPVKIQFYSGKQRLGTLVGKKRMRFDVTGYATKAKKGQLRVVVYDKKGKQTSRTLNVSPYIARQPVRVPSVAQQKKQTAKDSKQHQMKESAIKKRMSHSADFDSSSKAIREFSKTRRLHQTLPQSDKKVRQKEQKDKTKETSSRKRVILAKNKEQNKKGNDTSMAATNDTYYGGHMRYNKGPSIDSGADDEPTSLRAARGAALLMPYIDSARASTPYVLIEGNNFGNEAKGGVRMVRSNTAGNPVMNYFLEVVSWSDTEIFSRLPQSLTAELQQLRSPLYELSGSFTVGLYRQGRWLSNIVSIEEEPIDLDFDNDGHTAERFGGDDCDDEDANRYPGNPEVGDTEGHDEDCNPTTIGADRDGDGYVSDQYWNDHPSHPKRGTDCNDSSAEINPGAPESCNYLDDDCDGQVDEGLAQMAYQDNDGDRFGDPDSPPVQVCFPGPSLVFNNTDCDDTRADVHPGQMEICNGRDDNCNGLIDEGVTWTLYRDRDGDLHGDPAAPVEFCPRDEPPPGLVINNDDCDDTDAAINPLAGTCP